jgi:ATP-dependent Clp protease adaptor protein ClpS
MAAEYERVVRFRQAVCAGRAALQTGRGGINIGMPAPAPSPGTEILDETKVREAFEKGWFVIVWNDPINLMSYVTYVFQTVLGFDRATARKHMLEVHLKGKSCVARETREKAEHYWHRLQQFGLKATLEKAS